MDRPLRFLKNLAFPRRCDYCGRVQGFAPECACAPALARCRLQGGARQLTEGGRRFDFLCGGFACWRYDGPVRAGVRRFKFGGVRRLGAAYGAQMAALCREMAPQLPFDLVTFVPASPGEARRRVLDAPALLAETVAKRLAIPLCDDILSKTAETARQHELPRAARRANLLGAFDCPRPQAVREKRILLCDDIATTGATLDECAKMLRLAGARTVTGLVFAAVDEGCSAAAQIK